MKDIIFITFDIPRPEYPTMSYSIASIIAAVQNAGFISSHLPIDVKQFLQDRKEASGYIGHKKMSFEELVIAQEGSNDLTNAVIERLKANLNYLLQFRYIAISVTRWSIDHCNALIEILQNYTGKIILGGYEITAIQNELLLTQFPKADHFIKGYAEKAIIKILSGEIEPDRKLIIEKISSVDLISPYLTGVLGLYSRKIYWESKRGCRFSCGFCEWGALKERSLVEIDLERLKLEIDLIGNSNVEELNILDGTFNFGRKYLEILDYILKNTNLKVTFQARFEMLKGTKAYEFLKLCSQYRERIHLEFGLQTIHDDEMQTIGRTNNMDKIQYALLKLNELELDYETSIIYAIPGQSVEKMIDTIEYLLTNNCKKICAYPLQIAKNSDLENHRNDLVIIESIDELKVRSVESSYSFTKQNRSDMDLLAERLATNELSYIKEIQSDLKLRQVTDFQYEVLSIEGIDDVAHVGFLIDKYFEDPTNKDYNEIDFYQSAVHLGNKMETSATNREHYINELLSRKRFYEIKKSAPVIVDCNGNELKIKTSDRNIKFYCNLRLGKSGNFYVIREIVYED
jgi:hypothetical protein